MPHVSVEREIGGRLTKKHAPGLVILGGCESCDMADKFLSSGAQCVICFDAGIEPSLSAGFIKDVMWGLCASKKKRNIRQSFGAALKDARKKGLWVREEEIHGSDMVKLKCRGSAHMKTLKELTR